MPRFLALAAGLAASVSAQDCTIFGIPTEIERTGVFLDFVSADVSCNNLGGMGPDTDCPEEIRYSNIGTDFGMSGGPEDDMLVDLVVRNLTQYLANNPERNGRTEFQTGELGQVNLRDFWSTKFMYTFVRSGGDPMNQADLVVFTTSFDFFYYDIDFGEEMRLTESLLIENTMTPPGVTTINEACTDRNQPTPCLMTTVLRDNQGNGVWNVTAGDRGFGSDNAETPAQILQPVADMDDFDRFAATRYINVSFPAGISSFMVTYEVTAADIITQSGRNFQYSVIGNGEARQLYAPCYFCDRTTVGSATTCVPCGIGVDVPNGEPLPPCPLAGTDTAFNPSCPLETANMCIPGNPSYPACLSSCAAECEQESQCREYVCTDFQCRLCGDPDDECAVGSACFEENCGQGTGFPTLAECNADGGPDGDNCVKYVCVPELQECFACDSDVVTGIDPDFCNGKPLFNNPGFNCRQECAPPVARKDPHLYLPHGGHADFRGANNETFAMLSAKDVAFNVLIEEADFNWAKRVVHGTKMAAAYWVVRTSTGRILKAEYNATSKAAIVHEDGERDVHMTDGMPGLVVDNVQITFAKQKLSVLVADKWLMTAASAAFPFGNLAANKHKHLLDISIEALYDADHDKVAPHGIFGQAYDGDDIGVSGKTDKSRDAESTTTAQAEGAIEGVWYDYKVPSRFGTNFKYSRFDANAAKPRDVSKLTGEKTKAVKHIVGSTDLPAVQ